MRALVVILAAGPFEAALGLDLERRRMLTAIEHADWKGVGRVNVAAISEQGMCTGTLIDEDLVITAAHCVYSERLRDVHAPGNVHFVAGWRRGTKIASRKAVSITVHPAYDHTRTPGLAQIGADLALIRLEAPIRIEDAPFFPVGEPAAEADPLTLISYRRDRPHALTRQDGCDLRGAEGAVMVLNCDVTFGASGSPLFRNVDGERRIVGVISAKGHDNKTRKPLAFAVRVDKAMPELLPTLK